MLRELVERITELERKVGNMLFYAVVLEAKENKVRVAQGDLITGWIPVFQPAAGSNVNIFMPIKKDEEVCVLCPNGSIENGIAIRGLHYSKIGLPPDSSDKIVIVSDHEIQLNITGNAKITASGDAEITAANAKIDATGNAEISAANVNIKPSGICAVGNGAGGVLTAINTKCPVLGVAPSTGSVKLFSD